MKIFSSIFTFGEIKVFDLQAQWVWMKTSLEKNRENNNDRSKFTEREREREDNTKITDFWGTEWNRMTPDWL